VEEDHDGNADPDSAVLSRKPRIVERLQEVLGKAGVIHEEAETRAYECDALTAYKCPPLAVVLPSSDRRGRGGAEGLPRAEGVPVVPRGAGTSLAGGALPTADSVILGVARLNRVLEIDYDNRFIRVQSGRTNLSVTGAVEERILLRPRPVEPAGLRHRGQRRDEFRRGALPEIRGDDEQPAGRDHGHDGRQVMEIGGAHLDAAGYDLLG
jgi:glycolate oxidase